MSNDDKVNVLLFCSVLIVTRRRRAGNEMGFITDIGRIWRQIVRKNSGFGKAEEEKKRLGVRLTVFVNVWHV